MGFYKRTVTQIPVNNKTVLVRADYNVPLTSKGKIADDFRIKASLPTLEYLLEHNAKVVIISHLGRPNGREGSLSLEPVAKRLEKLLGQPVQFVDDVKGDKVVQAVKKAPLKSVTLLENLRFYKEEEANDEAFAKAIAKSTGAREFVQDGFGVVHRAHASTDAITNYIPAVAGLLLEREYTAITKATKRPKRPLVTIIGGAKVSDKIPVIEKFVKISDKILVGGAMANTFLRYKGYDMGASKIESGQEGVLDRIYTAAHKKLDTSIDDFIILPRDVAVGKNLTEKTRRRNIKFSAIKPDDIALDIGDETIERFVNEVKKAKTVIWNGTLGYAEREQFAHGSARVALALATQADTTSIIGGGDTSDFVLKWDGDDGTSFTHVSTGGGASLELMAGKKLPGIERLLDAPR